MLHAIGEDESTRGHIAAALAAFREAHRTTAEQLARAPDDPERIFAHSQSEYCVGSIDQQRGNYGAALDAYRRYRAQAGRMNQLVPDDPRYVGELAYSESNLGSVYLNGLDRPRLAREHFQRSLHWFERTAQLQPGNREWIVEAADAHGWIADSWFNQRRYAEARAERLAEQRMKVGLLRQDPDNRAYLYATVIPIRSLARIDIETRDFGRAGMLRAGAIDHGEAARARPGNVAWRDQATMIELDLVRLFIAAGGTDDARAALAIPEHSRRFIQVERPFPREIVSIC